MILLDTCSLIWLAAQQNMLSKQAIAAISKNAGNIYISAISAFEIAIKTRKKLIQLPATTDIWYQTTLTHHGIIEIPINSKIAIRSANLPIIHKDPADRIIIATALEKHLKIITPDIHISSYPQVNIIW